MPGPEPEGLMNQNEPLQEGEIFYGPSKTLTDAHFLFFSAVSGDNHPIHYDVEYAKGTRFGKPVAHGLLLASLTALGATPREGRGGSMAIVEQGCRFLAPAFVGDTIQPRLQVERIWEEAGRKFCRFKTALTNQRDETILEGFHLYRVFDRVSGK
jgi:3-hydroxybutyryl-CoA dehydratase